MLSAPITEITVSGLVATFPASFRKFFLIKKKTWIPHQKKTKYVDHLVGETVNGRIEVGFGLLQFLKNNPYFCSQYRIKEFPSLKNWKLLDVKYLDEFKGMMLSAGKEMRVQQYEAVLASKNAVVGNVVIPMAGGKTSIILAIAYILSRQGQNVIFTSPTLKTRQNFLELAAEMSVDVSVYESPRHRFENASGDGTITVVSSTVINSDVETGLLKEESLSVVTALLTDEADNWTKESWWKLYKSLRSLNRSLGFSATSVDEGSAKKQFEELDPKTAYAIAACGNVVYRSSIDDVKDDIDVPDLLEIPFVWDPEVMESLNVEGKEVRDWPTLRNVLYGNEDRNSMLVQIIETLQSYGRTVLVPINNKARIKELMQILESDKAVAWLGDDQVLGADGRSVRPEGLKERITSGEYNVIFATSHMNSGFDLPVIDAVLLSEDKDKVITIQRTGRVIRKSKNVPVVINLADDSGVYKTQATVRRANIVKYYGKRFQRVDSPSDLKYHLK